MKSLFKKVVIAPAVCSFLTPIIAKADLNIPAGTIHYLEENNSIYTSGGTYNGRTGIKFESEASCSSTDYDSNALTNSVYNRACINRMIQTSGTSGIKIAPNTTDASVTIGSGTDATSINQSGVSVSGDYLIKSNSDGTIQLGSDSNDIDISSEGLSIGGDNLIKKSSDGVTSIGKNSLKLQESNGLQKMWATDAAGKTIPIDITNGTKLLINGRDVEQSINNVGALSAALTGLPTVPTDTTLACGLGTGTHGGDFAFSGGCASQVNEKLSINYAASMTMPGQDYAGDFEDTFSARAGFVWKLGKSVKPNLISMKDEQKLSNEIKDLKNENKNLNEKIMKFENEKIELLARLERLEKIALSETNSQDLATIKLP